MEGGKLAVSGAVKGNPYQDIHMRKEGENLKQ
jgi:hypothetical protein